MSWFKGIAQYTISLDYFLHLKKKWANPIHGNNGIIFLFIPNYASNYLPSSEMSFVNIIQLIIPTSNITSV